MDIHLKAKLQDVIGRWVEENADEDDWPSAYFGDRTLYLMVDAAASVFDAVVEFQEYAVEEGLFDKS